MNKHAFYRTKNDPSDLDVFEEFSLVDPDSEFPYIIAEKTIPNATRSGASMVRNTRWWEMDEFEGSSAPVEAKEAFKRFVEARNTTGT